MAGDMAFLPEGATEEQFFVVCVPETTPEDKAARDEMMELAILWPTCKTHL